MVEQLRTLPPPLRYSVYAVGVLLMFFMAAGLGATAAVGVGWQFERAGLAPGHTGAPTPERGKLEKIAGSAEGSGATAVDSPNEKEYEASFTHRANEDNSRGDYTYISDPSIDGDKYRWVHEVARICQA